MVYLLQISSHVFLVSLPLSYSIVVQPRKHVCISDVLHDILIIFVHFYFTRN